MGIAERADAPVPQRPAALVAGVALVAMAAAAHPLAYAVWDTVAREPEALAHLRAAADPEHAALRPARRATLVLLDGLRMDEWSSLVETRELLGEPRPTVLDPPTHSMPYYHALFTGVPAAGTGVRRNATGTRARLDSLADRVRASGGTVGWIAEGYDALPVMFGAPADLAAHGADALEAPLDAALGDPPDLLIVHVLAVDQTAHDGGVRTAAHREALALADRVAGAAVRAADREGRAVVVLSDHGHMDRGGHGGEEPDVARAPIAARGVDLSGWSGRVEGIAPRLARAMGVPPPRSAVDVPGSPAAAARAQLLSEVRRRDEARRGQARAGWLAGTVLLSLMLLGTTKRAFRGFDAGTLLAPLALVAGVLAVHLWGFERPLSLSAIDDGSRHGTRLALLGAGAAAAGIGLATVLAGLRRHPPRPALRRAAAATGWAALALGALSVAQAGGALGPWPLSGAALYAPILAIGAGGGACAVAGVALIAAGFGHGDRDRVDLERRPT